MHRTGTTSIQKFLDDNQIFLEEKGIRVFKPSMCEDSNSSNYFLAESEAPYDRYSEFKRFLGLDCDVGVVSAEELSRLEDHKILDLSEVLAGAKISVKIVAYIRQPNDYIDSAAAKLIESSGCTLYGLISNMGIVPRYDRVAEWAKVFENKFNLLPYDQYDQMPLFIKNLGLDPGYFASIEKENKSFCLQDLLIMAALNDSRYRESMDFYKPITKISNGARFVAPKEVVESVGGVVSRYIKTFNSLVSDTLDPLYFQSRPNIAAYSSPDILATCINHIMLELNAATETILGNGANCLIDSLNNPSSEFDSFGYLIKNPDIRYLPVSPHEHYQNHGINEGRKYINSEVILKLQPVIKKFSKNVKK